MLFDLAGANEWDPAYPYKQVFFTGYEPGGAEQMVKKFSDTVFPQMAAIIESVCTPLGLRADQISRYFTYRVDATYKGYPAAPYPGEQEYANRIPVNPYGLTGLGAVELGAINVQSVALDAATDAAKKMLGSAATSQASQAASAAGGGVLAAGAVASGVALAAYAIINYKQMMKNTNARVTAGFGAATTVTALFIPVVGWIGAAAMAVKGLIDYRHGANEMKKEAERANQLAKSMQSVADILVAEATKLAQTAASRGIPLLVKPSGAFKTALWNHYLYLWFWQHNRKIKKKMAVPELKGGVVNVMRRARLTMLLKCATDMHKLSELVVQLPALPENQVKEVLATTRAIVEAAPGVPFQAAVNAAQQVVAKVIAAQPEGATPVPGGKLLTPEARAAVATQVATAAQKQQTQETTAEKGGGLVPVATVVGTIALMFG